MNTIIEEKELDNELQELRLLSKSWISEVQFLSGELKFLKRLVNQTVKDQTSEKASQLQSNMMRLEQNIDTVRNGIVTHLKYLEKLIIDPSQQFNLAIIEDHISLERKIIEDFQLIRSCKQDVFSFVR